MQRSFLWILLAVIIISGVVFGIGAMGKTALYNKVGDLQPAMAPALKMAIQAAGKDADSRLKLPDGFKATIFTTQTPGARDLQFSPDGTLVVSLKATGKVVALPDRDNDGVADKVVELISGLRNPHGLAFRNGKLFIAEERQVNRYIWDETNLTATFEQKIVDLPGGGAGHVTRSLLFDSQGNLYISVGSTCNACEEKDERNAAVLITNENGDNVRIFSSGLRNAVFMTLKNSTDKVWVTDNGRDLLGDNIPPDDIDILQDGGNFGWPYCYGDNVVDTNFGGKDAAYCNTTIPPVFKLQAHSAALGLTFVDSRLFPDEWQGDLLVAFHGSWNRSVPTGYKVVRLKVDGERVLEQTDFMTGFLQGSQTLGRPVDLTFDTSGRLYISDDKAGLIYVITHTQP